MKRIAYVLVFAVLLLCAAGAEAGMGLSQSSGDDLGATEKKSSIPPAVKNMLSQMGRSTAEIERAETILSSPEVAQFLQNQPEIPAGGDLFDFMLLALLVALIVVLIIALSHPYWLDRYYY